MVRIGITLAALLPFGFLLGFAFHSGLRMVVAVDNAPTLWFWGINRAAGVLASVIAVLVSMSLGINATPTIAAGCYLPLIPASFVLHALKERAMQEEFDALLAGGTRPRRSACKSRDSQAISLLCARMRAVVDLGQLRGGELRVSLRG